MTDIKTILGRNKETLILPDGICVVSVDHSIITFNEAAERITGYEASSILGRPIALLFSQRNGNANIFTETFNDGKTHSNLWVDIVCSDGTVKNVLASITPVWKNRETIINAVAVFRDTREMLQLAEELSATTSKLIDERNKLEAIFNSNIEGTFTIDNEWTVTSFNNSAVAITGYTRDEAIGKKCWEIFKSTRCRNGCHMETTMSTTKATIGNELAIVNASGTSVPIRVNSGILVNNKNVKMGAVETFVDITVIQNLIAHISQKFQFGNIIGNSKSMERIFRLFESVSQTGSTVLLTGESGTGKELAARSIHVHSAEKNGPFIALNCSAFAESLIESELFGHEAGAFTGATRSKPGRFELANGGTLFLDEIGDISMQLQTKLLRILETKQFERVGGTQSLPINARIITATNKDLEQEIRAGRFREDLYYRINVINIHLPPLRDRTEDLPLLIDHFIKIFNGHFRKSIDGITNDVYRMFTHYHWPGNIRELENVLEHCFVLCHGSVIGTEHLPDKFSGTGRRTAQHSATDEPLRVAEKDTIVRVLQKNAWNKKLTATELGIDASTLWRKMKRLAITPP